MKKFCEGYMSGNLFGYIFENSEGEIENFRIFGKLMFNLGMCF